MFRDADTGSEAVVHGFRMLRERSRDGIMHHTVVLRDGTSGAECWSRNEYVAVTRHGERWFRDGMTAVRWMRANPGESIILINS